MLTKSPEDLTRYRETKNIANMRVRQVKAEYWETYKKKKLYERNKTSNISEDNHTLNHFKN